MVPKFCAIDECDKHEKPLRRSMCKAHYAKWLRATPPSERIPIPAEERFWARVDRGGQDECWLWLGAEDSAGYGAFSLDRGKKERTHRVSLRLKLGRPLASGAFACHTCDNRMCVNPAHIYEGTPQSNIADAVTRGRNSRGTSVPASRLSEEDALSIRIRSAAGEKNINLAAEYGVVPSVISAITHGNAWSHVGGPRSYKQKQKPRQKKAA